MCDPCCWRLRAFSRRHNWTVRLVEDDFAALPFKGKWNPEQMAQPFLDPPVRSRRSIEQDKPAPAGTQELAAQCPRGPRLVVHGIDLRRGDATRQTSFELPGIVQQPTEGFEVTPSRHDLHGRIHRLTIGL